MLSIEILDLVKYDNVKNITSSEYFSADEYAHSMFDTKYCTKWDENGDVITDTNVPYTKIETPADVFWRVASGLASMEATKELQELYRDRWFALMWLGWFRPGGSVLAGVGAASLKSLLNCTTLPLSKDSLEGINKLDYDIMKCAAFRQGLGFDGSILRPRGAKVNNAAEESTGTVPWICKLVDNGEWVGQKGRKPAILVSLKDHHPDIYEFIAAKSEKGILENANISVQISNKFIEAVKNNAQWELYFEFEEGSKYERISKVVPAKELFDLIAEQAYKHAEPGVQYIDLLREGSMVHQIFLDTGDGRFKIISTNAPVIGSSMVATKEGLFCIEDLYEKGIASVLVDTKHTDNIDQYSYGKVSFKEATFNKYDNQPLYNVTLSNGRVLSCNDVHEWLTVRGYVKTKDLTTTDKILLPSDGIWTNNLSKEDKGSSSYKDGLLVGWFVGDGFYTNLVDTWLNPKSETTINKRRKGVGFIWSIGEEAIFDIFKNKYKELVGKDFTYIRDRGTCYETRTAHKKIYDWLLDLGFDGTNKYIVPKRCFTDRVFAAGFLAALLGSDGYVPTPESNSSIILTTVSEELANKVAILASAFGIYTSIKQSIQHPCTYTVAGEEKLSNCKKYRYDVSFGNYGSKLRLFNRVGIFHTEKFKKLDSYLSKGLEKYPTNLYVDVLNVEDTGDFTTMYCGVVPEIHGLVIDGVLSSNCSEKSLPPYGVCNLLSPNHAMFSVDEEEYKQELAFIVPYMVRLSDNVVSYELYHKLSPLQEQAWILEQTREIGMGITNIHGWLLKQDLAYDSDEAIQKVGEFFKYYSYNVFKASMALGDEKGNAPAFNLVADKQAFMGSSYFRNIVNEFFGGDCTKISFMRNMAHMSVAPTGSLSSTFPIPCFSYGVEPFTGPYWWRRTRAIDKGKYTHYFIIPDKIKQYVLGKLDKSSEEYEVLNAFPGSVFDDDGLIGISLAAIIDNNLPKGFFKPSHYIDPLQKVKLMGAIYKWVDAAISCTYNLPASATVKDVENIYMEAYNYGVRAVSVYVDGSREGILIFEDPKTNAAAYEKKQAGTCDASERPLGIVPNCAPKRPKELPCDIFYTSIKGEMWTVLVGLLDGKPYEVFCGTSEDLYLPKTCSNGIIRKQGKGKYELDVVIKRSPVVYKDLASILMTDGQKGMTRLLSLALRHGALPKYIVEQLKKTNGSISDFSTAISRVLSKYVDAYVLSGEDSKCPNCGELSLVNVEGCIKCVLDCGYSRCS